MFLGLSTNKTNSQKESKITKAIQFTSLLRHGLNNINVKFNMHLSVLVYYVSARNFSRFHTFYNNHDQVQPGYFKWSSKF